MAEAMNNKQVPVGNRQDESIREMAIIIFNAAPPTARKEGLKPSIFTALRAANKTLGFADDSGYFLRNMLVVSEIKPTTAPLWFRSHDCRFFPKRTRFFAGFFYVPTKLRYRGPIKHG